MSITMDVLIKIEDEDQEDFPDDFQLVEAGTYHTLPIGFDKFNGETGIFTQSKINTDAVYSNQIPSEPQMRTIKFQKSEFLYQCGLCDNTFTQEEDLTKHLTAHNSNKSTQCFTCLKSCISIPIENLKLFSDEKSDNFTAQLNADFGIHQQCDTCLRSSSSFEDLKQDKLIAPIEKTEKPVLSTACRICKRKFKKNYHLTRHMATHSNEKQFNCTICDKAFMRKDGLNMHIKRVHTAEKRFQCNECNRCFFEKYSLKRHMVLHNGFKTEECETCNELFSDKYMLAKHSATHSDLMPHKCEICSKTFSEKKYLTIHETTHTDGDSHTVRIYNCSVCPKSFTRHHNLKSHLLIHSSAKPYECDICRAVFARKHYIKSHMFSIHIRNSFDRRCGGTDTPFKCKMCHLYFMHSSELTKHLTVHIDEKRNTCKICGASFTGCKLKQHMRQNHSSEKLFHCDICSKSFTEKGSVKIHMRVHTGEKPFQCTVCHKRFTKTNSMRKHILRIHTTGARPYPCELCSKSFTEKYRLRDHMRVHTGDNRGSFRCKICYRSYANRNSLLDHIFIVHNGGGW